MDKTNTSRLDALTARHTAYPTWDALVAACRTGYVPTLRQAALVAALTALGLRTWQG